MRVVVLDPSCTTWTYTHYLCECLVAQGHEVFLVASQFLYLESVGTGSYHKVDHFYNRTMSLYGGRPRGFSRRYVKGAEHIVDMLRLPKLLESIEPDVIHYQQAPIPLVDRWFLARLARIAPLVSTVHNTEPFHGDASRLQLWGFASFLARFDHLIAHTQYSLQRLEQLGMSPDRISVIRGGQFDHYTALAEPGPSGTPADDLDCEHRVLFFGALSLYKGLDILIRAFALLPAATLGKTRLMICGNPQMPMASIMALAREVGVHHRIDWDMQFIPEEQIHGIFARATVLALPYRHIDDSGVLAMIPQYRIPIVASRIGGFAEMLEDGVHGHVVEPEDPAAFAAALDDILSDPQKIQDMGDAVGHLADEWISWEEVARRTTRVYEDLKSSTSLS